MENITFTCLHSQRNRKKLVLYWTGLNMTTNWLKNCHVGNCRMTTDTSKVKDADAIIFNSFRQVFKCFNHLLHKTQQIVVSYPEHFKWLQLLQYVSEMPDMDIILFRTKSIYFPFKNLLLFRFQNRYVWYRSTTFQVTTSVLHPPNIRTTYYGTDYPRNRQIPS